MWLLSDLHDWLNGQGPRLILCIGAGIYSVKRLLKSSWRREDIPCVNA